MPAGHPLVAGKTQLGQLCAPPARTEIKGHGPTAQLGVYQALRLRAQQAGAETKFVLPGLAPGPLCGNEFTLVAARKAAAERVHRLQQYPPPGVQRQQLRRGGVAPSMRILKILTRNSSILIIYYRQ